MEKYKIFKNFLSHIECDELNNWIYKNKDTNIFRDARMRGNRITTRHTDCSHFNFPDLAYQIQKRIISILNIQNYFLPPYKDGMVASYALPGDTCYNHLDPQWYPNTRTLHCNAVLNNFKGGEAIIEDKIIPLEKTDLICYFVSEINHGSQVVLGDNSRNLWIFGFCV